MSRIIKSNKIKFLTKLKEEVMKKSFFMVTVFIFLLGCVATNKTLWEKPNISVDPTVSQWLNAPAKSSLETLGVIVISKAPLADFTFLKKIKRNYYTGHLTKSQLKKLIKDERIARISAGKQDPLFH